MAPCTILLVDPDQDSLAIYSAILRHHGFEVLCSHDGDEALRVARARQPSLVLTELLLSPTQQKILPMALREDPSTAHLPVVVVSAWPERPNPFASDLAGFAGYLTKPCLPSRLVEEVRRLVGAPLEITAV